MVRTDNGDNLLAQQLLGSGGTPPGHNEKTRYQWCSGCPQPLLFIVLSPTGLINIDLLLLLHMGLLTTKRFTSPVVSSDDRDQHAPVVPLAYAGFSLWVAVA